jgi:hypothetical protein
MAADCLIRYVSSLLQKPEESSDAFLLLLHTRLVSKSWCTLVMQSASEVCHQYALKSVGKKKNGILCSLSHDFKTFSISLGSLKPPSCEEISKSLAEYILNCDGNDDWDREQILSNLNEGEDDETIKILQYGKDDMAEHIFKEGGLNCQIFGVGPAVSFKREEGQDWQDIGKVLGLFKDAPLEGGTHDEAPAKILRLFKFILILVCGNKTEGCVERPWLISTKQSFYHEHLDFGSMRQRVSFHIPCAAPAGSRLWLSASAEITCAN